MEIRFYLKRPKVATSCIYALINQEGQVLKYYLTDNIPTVYWSAVTQRAVKDVKNFPEHPEFNARLDFLVHTIKTTYRKFQNDNNYKIPSTAQLKTLLDIATGKSEVTRITFLSYYEDF